LASFPRFVGVATTPKPRPNPVYIQEWCVNRLSGLPKGR
jgi:hypothetical protein